MSLAMVNSIQYKWYLLFSKSANQLKFSQRIIKTDLLIISECFLKYIFRSYLWSFHIDMLEKKHPFFLLHNVIFKVVYPYKIKKNVNMNE